MHMGILYQGFQIQKELDYEIDIQRYLLLLLMKYQWFRISAYYIYIKMLCKMFDYQGNQPFADLSILVVVDFLQLPPIKSPQKSEKIG